MTECFLEHRTVISQRDPAHVPDLLAYASLIIGPLMGNGWHLYDTNFHSQAAANGLMVWAQTNSLLWITVFNTTEAVPIASLWIKCQRNATRIQRAKSCSTRMQEPQQAAPTSSNRFVVCNLCLLPCVLGMQENHHIVQCLINKCFRHILKPSTGMKENTQKAGFSWPTGFQPFLSHSTLCMKMH